MRYRDVVNSDVYNDNDVTVIHIDRRHVVGVVSETNDCGQSETYNGTVLIEDIKKMDVKTHNTPRQWTTPFVEVESYYYEAEII